MNIISKTLFKIRYKELSSLGIDDELMELIINNQVFKEEYKDSIIPLIKELNGKDISGQPRYSNEQKIKAIKALAILNKNSDIEKCSSKLKDNSYELFIKYNNYPSINPYIINDDNFNKIYKIIHEKIFLDNISDIILKGKSDKLLDLIFEIKDIKMDKLSDKLIDFLYSNIKIDSIDIKKYIIDTDININLVSDIINNGYEEGLIWVLNNVGMNFNLKVEGIPVRIFDINFINNIGAEEFKMLLPNIYKLYKNSKYDISTMFKIYDIGNYELVKDIIKSNNSHFSDVGNDIDKNIYDIYNKILINQKGVYDIKFIYLNKKLNISLEDEWELSQLINDINELNITDEFKNKYRFIIDYFNIVYNSFDKLNELDSKFDEEKIEYIKNNLTSFMNECHLLKREVLSLDIKKRFLNFNKELKSVSLLDDNKKPFLSNNGNQIKVFELNGEPFTMLIHCIAKKEYKEGTNNANIGEKLLDNPSIWNTEEKGNNMICTSLINNYKMNNFSGGDTDIVTYGFYDIDSSGIYGTYNVDAGSNMTNDAFKDNGEVYKDIILQIKNLSLPNSSLKSGCWNEIIINRRNRKTKEKIQPNYLVCFDKINDRTIKHAKYFNIPIYVINTKIYQEQFDKLKEENEENSLDKKKVSKH